MEETIVGQTHGRCGRRRKNKIKWS